MTDLRELLRDAAPEPARAVDVDALVALAARRRRWRRPALWLTGFAVVLGLGGGSAIVVAPAGRPSRVETAPAPSAEPTEDRRSAPAVAAAAPAGDPADTAADTAVGEGTTTTTTAASSQPETTAPAGAEGCTVRGYDEDGVALGPNGGLSSGPKPSCRYRATRPGGYDARGTWEIEIRRNNEVIVLRVGDAPDCAPIGAIQPGDVVVATLHEGQESRLQPGVIRVGSDVSCPAQ